MELTLAQDVADTRVHQISVSRAGRRVTMVLDESHEVTAEAEGVLSSLNTAGTIFLGGGGAGGGGVAALTGGRATAALVGCVHSLVVNSRTVDFSTDAVAAANIVSCGE